MNNVFILGGTQSDFANNCSRNSQDIGELLKETVYAAAEKTAVDLNDVNSAHVGNFVGELFCDQGMLGAVLAEVVPEFNGLPISRHEAACASGSMAALAGMKDILSGLSDLVCVSGVELMRNVPGDVAAKYLGTAAWTGYEAQEVKYVWPQMFSDLADEYQKRYGLDYQHIGAIAENNFHNARLNPLAQTRHWDFNESSFIADDEANPIITGQVRRNDCGQITDGAATLFLASENYAKQYASRHGITLDVIPRIKGWGHKTAGISYAGKIANSDPAGLIFPMVQQTIETAFASAKLTLDSIDAIETHDCFAITEYMAIDHFGITAPGESWKAVEDGSIKLGGRLPINPSGGLIGLGHPVGATGVRMLVDAWKQTANLAEHYQVNGAENVATLNIGGSTSTIASFVVGV